MKTNLATPILAAAISALSALSTSAAMQPNTTEPDQQTAAPAPVTPLESGLLQPETRAETTLAQQMDAPEASVMQLTPDQLKRMTVVDPTGKEVGKVEQIVRSRHDESIAAVISSGGVLGFGAREIAVPVETLELADEKQLLIQASGEELQTRGDYVSEAYVELEPADRPISELSAFEPVSDAPQQQDSKMPGAPAPDAGATGTTYSEGQY
ncbi:PRC-barrel domain-containing protein [Marinobacterium rhizophilum]|uniref:PRC-barrel domain-containing protein n=1 Tax=Marinobacterium rhizophilum TaxID=420402 RepID=A0ABY5HL62_9GAMM|nr:PRC-barrel domain-containing protein [Marinobacterium rhizophilum]UTW12864.1 PRC-barrel domain-containing protein [Marinobacterium rhizophilum]